jgi:hypothetical protein
MIGGAQSIRENLTGAWQVMTGRADGLNRIDTSLEGFWRSFAAIVLVLPFAFLAFLSQGPLAAEAGGPVEPLTGSRLALEALALLVDWFAFPLLFALVAPPFGLGSRYVPFIVTRNWAAVIVSVLVGAVHALHLVGVIPTPVLPYVLIVVIAVALRFAYLIARLTLAVSMGMAAPIVILDFLISLTIWSTFDRLT